MLTRLLGSGLQNSPQINQEAIDSDIMLKKHAKLESLEDLFAVSTLSRKNFKCLHTRAIKVSLLNVEHFLLSAKHAVTKQLEDDFV